MLIGKFQRRVVMGTILYKLIERLDGVEACKVALEVLSFESEPQSTKTMTQLKEALKQAEGE